MPTTIDSLNDDVICHVLSFLPTKVSASTSILAKRWRFLWAHLPNFDFKGDGHNDAIKDPDIINRVIALHRDKTINTLSISGDMEYTSPDQLPSWITQAVNSGVRNLYLNFYFDNEFITVLPKCLLTCKTLVDFQLFHCRGITPSCGEVFWPSLKKLSLNHILFEDNESLPHMLSGCPVLQDLIIEGCYDWGCVFVSSLTIKKLDVQLVCGCCYRYGSVLKINAPSLEYLNVRNYCPENVMILGTMTSLIKADLNLIIGNLVWHDEQDIKESLIARRFLHCLCNVKCLKISMLGDDKLVEIAGLDSRVRFNNLTKLKIINFLDFHELVKFLEAADNLQLLIFTMDGMHKTYREPKLVPTCMLSCLKTVRIKSWDGGLNKNDFETIKYVLRNAQVLERLEIPRVFSIQNSDKEKLEMLERGSESCQLVFY